MGARLPPADRPRREGVKCDFCGRAVPSIAALRSHQNSLHSSALKKKELLLKKNNLKLSKVPKPVSKSKVAPKVLPKVNPDKKASAEKTKDSKDSKENTTAVEKTPKIENGKPAAVKVIPRIWKESMQKSKMEAESKTGSCKPNKRRKVEFQCPKCSKMFPVHFSAQKHIQKHHNDSSNTEDLKPIILELCILCNEKFPTPHQCPNCPSSSPTMMYKCVGCEQQFSGNKLFDVHVADIHGDLAETLFFPSEKEFTNWKEEMEAQTNCKYTVMGQYNSKQVHRCCNVPDDSTDDVVRFCPSSIISTDLAKGIQVIFYSDHHGHKYQEYKLREAYKMYSVKDLIQQAGNKIPNLSSEDNDLYLQFKNLMESIVLDAAKLNIPTLKVLINKAVDMTAIISQYDEDEEGSFQNRSTLLLTVKKNKKEDTTTTALDGLRSSKRNKRSIEENGTANKKLKASDTKKIKNSSFSLADEKDSDKILKELDRDNVKTKGAKSKAIEDTENVKTTKKNNSPHLTSMLNQSPQLSFNDSYKDFIKNNVPNSQVKKRNVVKTKMGQFKPSLSPKKVAKRNSIGKDMEYEVKEQENDCNILILKI